jgi:4-amino-4-deoxy-L-arabinose transferase-like glycosyltransferase
MIRPRKDTRLRLIGPLTIQSWLLLLSVCLVVYCVNLGGARVLSNNEIDVAGGARQMIAEGDWLTPKIGDHLWLEKPPLLHWFVASLIILSGEASEWVVRLPSVAAGIILVILVATMVGRWKGEKAGLVAGFIQGTSWYMTKYARLSEADMLLACVVVSAIVVFIHLQGIGLPRPSSRPRLWAIVFWCLIGLTNLCKGPLFGTAMTLMPCLTWLLWRRERDAWKRMWSPMGLVLGIFIAVAWYALVILREPSALDLWFSHTVGRALGDFLSHGRPWYYYLKKFPLQLIPWTFVTLFGAIPSLKRMWKEAESPDRFVWLWALVPIFFLSISEGRRHQYMLSCLPGFTLVTTIGMFELKQHIQARTRSVVAVSWLAIAVLAPVALVGGLVAGFRLPDYRVDAWMLGVLLGVGFMLAGVFALRRRPGRVFAIFLFIFVLGTMHAYLHILPNRDTRRHDRQFLTTLNEHLPPQSLLFATGGPEIARHIFYVRCPLIGVWYPEDIGNHLGEAQCFFVAGRMKHLEPLESYGKVTVLSQSEHTRNEKSMQDRYTLFRIQRAAPVFRN